MEHLKTPGISCRHAGAILLTGARVEIILITTRKNL